jgi:hypothetical protein
MKKRILLTVCILLFLAGFGACSRTPESYNPADLNPTATPTATPAPDITPPPDSGKDPSEVSAIPVNKGSDIHGAIHRVVYGENVAYIFGTIHGGMPDWFPLADVVEDALRRADVVLVEVDEIGISPEAMANAVMGAIFLPGGLTWVDLLPEDHYSHMVEMMDAWGVSYNDVNTMNPAYFVWQLTMSIAISLSSLDVSIEASVDNYIASIAVQRGLPVIGLEPIEQQLDIVYNPPLEVLLAMIMHLHPPDVMVEAFLESGELTLDEMAYFYAANDFAPINDSFAIIVDFDCPYLIYMREVVMDWRSAFYANEIKRLLRETEGPTTFFAAVGLSHVIRSGAHELFTDIIEQLTLAGFHPVPIWKQP